MQDAGARRETTRIQVTLATGIPEDRCRAVNLGYLDPAQVDIAAWQGREHEGVLVVPRAGEMLYRVDPGRRGVGAARAGGQSGRKPATAGVEGSGV